MAKTIVLDSHTGSRIPYLRGIISRSLHDSGLSFEKAYELSSQIREELSHTKLITSLDLRQMVVERLVKLGKAELVERYSDKTLPPDPITVIGHKGDIFAFSKSTYRRYLESSGVDTDQASLIISNFTETLMKNGKTEFPINEIGYRLYHFLLKNCGKTDARNYLVWRHFLASGRPLLLMIGGTTGSGKSTIANEAAHSLDIVRTQSTDMLREVMRMMIPEGLLPVLHLSSFAAWKALPKVIPDPDNVDEEVLIDGYSTQAELLSAVSQAVVNRALRERVSLILEGVHVKPTFLQRVESETDAVVVMIMLAVLKPDQLKEQIVGRGKKAPDRRAKRYLAHFDSIWKIQSNLLDEADQYNVPIVINDKKERVMREIMRIIVNTLSKDFNASPEKVFQIDRRTEH